MSKGCSKCKKSCCSGGCGSTSESANMAATLAELQETVDTLTESLKAFTCGHPILLIENADDVECFDLETGLGSDCWQGWALCDGQVQKDRNNKNFTTPNFVDRFIVHAGGEYEVGDTGGLKEVVLTVAQLAAHNHTVNDPGHTHAITDPGHTHAIVDDGHVHSESNHTHSFETASDGAHYHNVTVDNQGTGLRSGGETNTATSGSANLSTDVQGAHTHTGTTDAASGGGTGNAATGIEIVEAFTGITNQNAETEITLDEAGGDEAHENRPPYYAALYVIKL